jgi:SSS family solute:Na+ symporter
VAYAAIAIGALVPAAIMSIAAANLFTRNIYRDFFRRQAGAQEQATVAKVVSLVVKFGALAFVLGLNTQNAINLQLLGGVWILQTFPALAIGLFTRWLHRWALIVGWAAGMAYGTVAAYHQSTATVHHFATSTSKVPLWHQSLYIGFSALVLNLVVSLVLTVILRALYPSSAGVDETAPDDYVVERGDIPPTPLPEAGIDMAD